MPKLKGLDGIERFNLTLALIAYIETHGEITVEDAIRHFGCSKTDLDKAVRSTNEVIADDVAADRIEVWFAHFDIELYEEEGILDLDQGSFLTQLPKVSPRQAAALSTGLAYLASMPGFEFEAEVRHLQELLGKAMRTRHRMIQVLPAEVDPDVEAVREGILNGKRIECDYRNQRGERKIRQLDPLRIEPRPDFWYLKAYCPENQEVRTFRLDRMRDARVLDVEISDEAKKSSFLNDAVYVASETDTEVLVEVDPEAYRLIADSTDVKELAGKAKDRGTVRATIRVGYLPNIGHLIAKYGGAARVIEPEDARRYVREYAERALGMNSTGTDDSE